MMYKLLFITALLSATTYGSLDNILPVGSKDSVNEQIDDVVWQPSIAKKRSGKSCDDGNCLTRSDCLTKDGKAYELISSVRDKVKEKCKKIF